MLSKEFFDILCRPKCHGDLVHEPEEQLLKCRQCGMAYYITNDIPVLTIDDEFGSRNLGAR